MKVIAALPCAKKRIRLKKLIEYKNSQQEKVYFYGWNREDNIDKLNEELYQRDFLLKGGGFVNNKARLMYFLWFFVVLKKCLSFSKDDLIWAMGFESAFPAIIASKIKGFRVVFDDADRFVLLFKFPTIIKKIIRFFEIYTSINSLLHIIPSRERYDYNSKKFKVIKNTPTEEDLIKSKSYIIENSLNEFINTRGITIYVNGWLVKTRGLDVILKLLDINKNFKVLIAGKIGDDYAKKLLENNRVYYAGELEQAEALSLISYVHFIFTYYDPLVPINIYAESNKWGDAIFFGKPVLVNCEVLTSKFITEECAGFSCKYKDVESLSLFVDNCFNDINIYNSLCENMYKLKEKYKSFDEQIKLIF